jgi:hypothetical protein
VEITGVKRYTGASDYIDLKVIWLDRLCRVPGSRMFRKKNILTSSPVLSLNLSITSGIEKHYLHCMQFANSSLNIAGGALILKK